MILKVLGKMVEVEISKTTDLIIYELNDIGLLTIRGDLTSKKFKTVVSKHFNLSIPKKLSIATNSKYSMAWMSPDELLVIFTDHNNVQKLATSLRYELKTEQSLILDVSSSKCLFSIHGSLWREFLAKGSPIDLRPDKFRIGHFRRSRIGQVGAAFWSKDGKSVQIMCGQSYRDFFSNWLCNASSELSLFKFF